MKSQLGVFLEFHRRKYQQISSNLLLTHLESQKNCGFICCFTIFEGLRAQTSAGTLGTGLAEPRLENSGRRLGNALPGHT